MPNSLKSVLFLDQLGGNYLSQALILAPQFRKAYYHIPDFTPFKSPYNDMIGTGYDQIEVLTSLFDNLDKFDIVVIFDIGLSELARILKTMGKQVWGGTLDYWENNRDKFMEVQETLGMPSVDFEVVKGFKNLRKLMAQKKYNGWFAKINLYRNVFETFKYENANHSEPLLDKIQENLGPLGDDMIFVLQAPIAGDVIEIGYDGFVVNGKTSQIGLFGAEAKDAGFIAKFTTVDKMPKQIGKVNEAFTPALQIFQGSNFYSSEVRVDLDSGKGYFLDICARAGQPPSNLYLQMFNNWSQIIEQGTMGSLIEPEMNKRYGVEIILKSNWVNDEFLTVSFPPEYEPNVQLKGAFKRNGQHYIVPFEKATNYDLDAFGSVTVIGNDPKEIMEQAVKIAQSIEGYDVTFKSDVIEKLMEEIDNLENKTSFKF